MKSRSVTLIILAVALTVLVLKLGFLWTTPAFGEIGIGQSMKTDLEMVEFKASAAQYNHVTENEVAEYASNHVVTLDRFNVTTTGPTSETVQVIFGDVQLDELFEEKIDDWLGSQGYGLVTFDQYNNGTTFMEFSTLP